MKPPKCPVDGARTEVAYFTEEGVQQVWACPQCGRIWERGLAWSTLTKGGGGSRKGEKEIDRIKEAIMRLCGSG